MFCGVGVTVYPTQETKLSTAGREAELWASGALAERQLETTELPLLWTAEGKTVQEMRKWSDEEPAEGSLDSDGEGNEVVPPEFGGAAAGSRGSVGKPSSWSDDSNADSWSGVETGMQQAAGTKGIPDG